jgi:DNA-binding response OmpR family regulator
MKQGRILIVEDERSMADALHAGLKEYGYDATSAYYGENGFELFRQEHFDLVLLDVNLGDVDGFELCKRIRLADISVGIIMLTSLHELSNKTLGYDAGADDYIVKPFDFQELLLKINALLKRILKTATPVSVLKCLDLEVDLNKKEATRGNLKINLTAKEFHLLEFLLRNKNRVVSRAEIAMHVWGIDFNTNTNVIDVYISYLRNKIDRDFDVKLIHTHFGMGFMLKENES